MDEQESRGLVSHLLFTDDTLVFCDADPGQVLILLAGVVCFQSITGLSINLEKSMMFVIGDVSEPQFFADIFGCNWSKDPSRYLGFPLGERPNAVAIWDPVIRKSEQRLAGWASRCLSFGARITLIKSCLFSQTVYLCSLFRAPKAVINHVEQIQRNFLWNGAKETRKFHLASWELCKTSTSRGGLGILDFDCFNRAMLGKWVWKYAVERESWWRKLIEVKYDSRTSEWYCTRSLGGVRSSTWANVAKVHYDVWDHVYIDPGGGAGVSFWKDKWIPGVVLADSFPRVTAAAASQEARLSDVAELSGDRVCWNIQFLWDLRGGAERERERERVVFFDLLNSVDVALIREGPCRVVWGPNPDSSFSVSSLYRCLAERSLQGVSNFPADAIWKGVVPPKVCIFLWLVFHRRILTLDNLKRRGWQLANRCELCGCEEETIDHMFTGCAFVAEVWGRLLSVASSGDVRRGDIVETIRIWPTAQPSNMAGWFHYCILHDVAWNVWKERNRRVFRQERLQSKDVACISFRTVVDWTMAFGVVGKSDGLQWLRGCLQKISH
ncbi:unnamed protein product [Linum trigynum]|uniref:Reverse transcriptase domain-containing protein n=1 Tax=Linum trigynum TaxID=586398 RepID=A0AAV2DV75_9ROSI